MNNSQEEKKIATIIGKNVQKARKNHSIGETTQIAAAEKIGISRTAYLNIEKGIVVPKVTILLKISKNFNVSIEELLKGVEVE